MILNGQRVTWDSLLQVYFLPCSHYQQLNTIIPWNQDAALNRQLIKLFAKSPYCVSLDNPCFRLCLVGRANE